MENYKNIDLTKILKNAPVGLRLYSIVHGEVELEYVANKAEYPITTYKDGYTQSFTKDGKFYSCYDGETVLFPSKNQRDWSKFTAPWDKGSKFDPNTLKQFDKVLIKTDDNTTWVATLFSHIIEIHDEVTGNDYLESVTSYCTSSFCIPYNDDTKYLVGTTDEAPEYYRYWED